MSEVHPAYALAACASKHAYANMAEAREVASRTNKRGDGRSANAYHCQSCGKFHIGNSTEKFKKRFHGQNMTRARAARELNETEE